METFNESVSQAGDMVDSEAGGQEITSLTSALHDGQTAQDGQPTPSIYNAALNRIIEKIDGFIERMHSESTSPSSSSISSNSSDGSFVIHIRSAETSLNQSVTPEIQYVLTPIHVQWLSDEERHWNSIQNLNDPLQLEKTFLLKNPNLIAMKIVQCQDSFMTLLQSINAKTAIRVFELLMKLSSSAFEFHKSIVFEKLVSRQFFRTLGAIFAEDSLSSPTVSALANVLSKVYTEIYSNSDTGGLNTSCTENFKMEIEKFRTRLVDQGLIEEKMLIDKLLVTADSHDVRINRGNMYPFAIFKQVNVEPNKINSPYIDFHHYVGVQFGLLREDFNESTRAGISNYLNGLGKNEPVLEMSNNHLKVYPGVTLNSFVDESGLKYVIEFSDPSTVAKLKSKETGKSKFFRNGSLVFLTSAETPFLGNKYWLARVLYCKHPNKNNFLLYVSLLNNNQRFNSYTNLLLIEPAQFFEPYFRVMSVLRCIGKIDFPFVRQIVNLDTKSRLPRYLGPDSLVKINGMSVNLIQDSLWPEPKSLDLNSTQMESLKHALRNELAVIQGPPGTGKTYISKKIIQTLLDNKGLWCRTDGDCGVIIVVAASNHSVDELLKGLLFMGIKVLRIGNQSTQPILDDYNWNKLRKAHNSGIFFDVNKLLAQEQSSLVSDLKKSTTIMKLIDSNAGLIQYSLLQPFMELSSRNLSHLKENYENLLIPDLTSEVLHTITRLTNRATGTLASDSVYQLKIEDIQRVVENMKKDSSKIDAETLLGLDDAANFLKKTLAVPSDCNQENLERIASLCNSGRMNIENLSIEDRWHLYMQWKQKLRAYHCGQAKRVSDQLKDIRKRKEELLAYKDASKIIQSNAEVVGMTSSAAARLHKMMECLKPKIVVVEEAAHMLEPHTVASLTRHCEHLILVGDHRQLRPNTATLEIGKNNNFEYSLFERLIKNGMPHSTLTTQYRMRPEIAALIAPAVYPHLANDVSVEGKDHIKGVAADVFFMDHCSAENNDSTSLKNIPEAELCVLFCQYLMKQGYKQSQVTILAAYMEQKTVIHKSIQKNMSTSLIGVETVDSYQGHENDIILLSTVRSNDAGTIGFLASDNRVTVALSRAKIGLYIFGNASTLLGKKKSGIWKKVIDKLNETDSLGKGLPLKCESHGTAAIIERAEELRQIIKVGCQKFCEHCSPVSTSLVQ